MIKSVLNLQKFEKALFFVSVVALIASVATLYKYKEYLFKDNVTTEDTIAIVEQVGGDTRKRNPDSFKFNELTKGDKLANGDFLYSGEGAKILLKFVSGPRLMIGEQSLVVIREVDGTPDLKIQEGALSGSFDKDEEIEVMTDQESVIINGDSGAQFSIVYSSMGGLEVGSYEKPIRIQFDGKSTTLKNQRAKLENKKNIKVADNPQDGKKPKFEDIDTSPAAQPKRVPAGMNIGAANMQERISLDPPYPKSNHVFFHKTGGKIPVFPKLECAGSCEVNIKINGQAAARQVFGRGRIPLIYINVDAKIEGNVHWEFTDGGEKTAGDFKIRLNNEMNFKEAFANQNPIEVMN